MKSLIFKEEILRGKLEALKKYGEAQTRRLTGLDEINKEPDAWELSKIDGEQTYTITGRPQVIRKIPLLSMNNLTAPKPPYQVGEKVYVREPFAMTYASFGGEYPDEVCYFEWDSVIYGDFIYSNEHYKIFYKLDGIDDDTKLPQEFNMPWGSEIKWLSPYAMSEKQARHFPIITSVKLQRVQEITEHECLLEGIEKSTWEFCITPYKNYSKRKEDQHPNNGFAYAPASFASLWNSLAKKQQDKWEHNPWVLVIGFKE
jgi:hypothetical protein